MNNNMKQLVFLVLAVMLSWHLTAQRPLISASTPGYMFVPPPEMDHVEIIPQSYIDGPLYCNFNGNAYRPGHAVTVYGVAVAATNLEVFPYLWVHMLRDSIVDSATLCYAVDDTLRSELFCFIEQEPVPSADIRFVATQPINTATGLWDTLVFPFYEFYFSQPVPVPAGQRFFVGVSHSSWNVYNHWYKGGNPYWPYGWYKGPFFLLREPNGYDDPYCNGDGLDSTWSLWKDRYPGLVDWACGRCDTPPQAGTEGSLTGFKYSARGFYPIIRPPEDGAWVHPPHEHPLRARPVSGFRLTELDSAHAAFKWDTLPPSDWGVVGVNADAYQVNYAPYMQEYEEGDTLVRAGDSCTLYMAFDSTVMYKARCRARSHHICDIHDTVVWGEWSAEVYFHTGVGVPDTVPLECLHVEGLRYDGLVDGNPMVSWDRCEGQDSYDVQYAAVGGSWQPVPSHNATSSVLYGDWVIGRRYMVRVRARCRHQCHIHDTLMMSEWCEPLEFTYGEWTEGVGECGVVAGVELFTLAPNPASGVVAVRPSSMGDEYPAVLTVSDTKGREVLRQTLTDGRLQTIDVATLPAGAYLITLTTRTRRTATQRLVVE